MKTLTLPKIGTLALLLGTGCRWDEGLTIEDMTGTVRLPEAAATRTVLNDDGSSTDVTNVAFIGPVYLGLYPSVQTGIEAYPYPEVGPQFIDGLAGDTYPYGGTTVGDLRYACVQFLQCKFVSGRYATFDDLVAWFRDTLKEPIVDQFGDEVETGDYLRQTCYDLLQVNSDEELRMTAYEDRNGDNKIDANDLDFVQQNDGSFLGEFTIWQQEYFDNAAKVAHEGGPDSDVHGFSLWGFMDSPSDSGVFSTCDPTDGYLETHYNNHFFGGRAYQDILNQPAFYISDGDWVSSEGYVYENWYDAPELSIDLQVGQ